MTRRSDPHYQQSSQIKQLRSQETVAQCDVRSGYRNQVTVGLASLSSSPSPKNDGSARTPPGGGPMHRVRLSALVTAFADPAGLSAREREIVRFSAAGEHRKAIADRLGCSVKTIDEYWRRIRVKTGMPSELSIVAELLRRALQEVPQGDLR